MPPLSLTDTSPDRYKDFVAKFGEKYTTLRADLGFARDTRDSLFYPTRGGLQSVFAEVGLPGGDLEYYKLSYQQQWLTPLTSTVALLLNGEIGYAKGYGGKELAFFKNFYAGGVGSVRGYKTSSLGPRDTNGDALGGNRRFTGNIEVLFPMPGLAADRNVRLSGFVDLGQVFGQNEPIAASGFRYSTGLAVSWFSPIGPLKFSVATPINKKEGDQIERFQFLLGKIF